MGSKDTKKKVIDEESRVESGNYVRTPDGKNVAVKRIAGANQKDRK